MGRCTGNFALVVDRGTARKKLISAAFVAATRATGAFSGTSIFDGTNGLSNASSPQTITGVLGGARVWERTAAPSDTPFRLAVTGNAELRATSNGLGVRSTFFGSGSYLFNTPIRATAFGIGAERDTDAFRVSSLHVAAVPLPAAGWMLLAGFGGLATLRRRAKKTA